MEHGEQCLLFWEEETTQYVSTTWGEQVPVETYEGLPIMTELALFVPSSILEHTTLRVLSGTPMCPFGDI